MASGRPPWIVHEVHELGIAVRSTLEGSPIFD